VLVALGTAMACLGIIWIMPKPFFQLATSALRQLDILLDTHKTEREQEKLILSHLGTLLKSLFVNLFLLSLLAIVALLPAGIYSRQYDMMKEDTSSLALWGSMLAGSLILVLFRRKNDYGYWSRLLHTLVLDNRNLGRFLFKRETRKISSLDNTQPFVIVSGLARAGTTAMTQFLFDKGVFHATRYANMPFLLAPKSWRRFYHPKKNRQKERAHRDGISVSEQSVEAFEEYFFRVFLSDTYVEENALKKHEVPDDVLSAYYAFQELYRQKPETLYLAKNNNFLLRYESLRKQNRAFHLVLLFREPLAHAQSLLRQHQNFLHQQTEAPFTLQYMDWLGHYEFGVHEKRFKLGNTFAAHTYSTHSLSYWLAIWIHYYDYVLNLPEDPRLYLISHQDLLAQPEALFRTLSHRLDIPLNATDFPQRTVKTYPSLSITEEESALLSKATDIYHQLQTQKMPLYL